MPIDRHSRAYKTRRDIIKKRWAAEGRDCWLCEGKLGPIDYNGPAGAALSAELDHSVAVSKGGSVMDVSGWRPAHAKCNRSRQAIDADEYRAKLNGKQPEQPPQTTRRTTYWGDAPPPSGIKRIPPINWR